MATGDGKKPARARVVLMDIFSRAWEHLADKGAPVALRRTGWMGTASTWINDRFRRGNESA